VSPQRSTGRFDLKPAQQRVLGVLKSECTSRLTRARYEELAGVSRSQAAYDLAELVEAGILERLGEGRATRYRLVQAPAAARGGRRRWTHERIKVALEAFCAGRSAWPSPAEFREAGRFDLYVAASRYGGIPFWIAEVGLDSPRPVHATRQKRRWIPRPRTRLVAALGVAAVALTAAGAGRLQLSHGTQLFEAQAPTLSIYPTFTPMKTRAATGTAKRRASSATHRPQHVTRSRPVAPQSSAPSTAGVHTAATVSYRAPAQTSGTSASSSSGSSSSGPAPLAAPPSRTIRRPLPPPPPSGS
jgi:DNA-binding transcriptional ArsR family regulator